MDRRMPTKDSTCSEKRVILIHNFFSQHLIGLYYAHSIQWKALETICNNFVETFWQWKWLYNSYWWKKRWALFYVLLSFITREMSTNESAISPLFPTNNMLPPLFIPSCAVVKKVTSKGSISTNIWWWFRNASRASKKGNQILSWGFCQLLKLHFNEWD